MKKLFLTFLFAFVALFLPAQDSVSVSHLLFENIEMKGDIYDFSKVLQKQGFKQQQRDLNQLFFVFKGTVLGHSEQFKVNFSKKTKTVWRIMVQPHNVPLDEIVDSLTALSGVDSVRILVEGEAPDPYVWRSLSEPLSSYDEVIGPVSAPRGELDTDLYLALPGLDSVLVGPYDLSASMGKAGQWDDPEVAAAYDEVARKAKAAGVLLGVSLEVEYAAWKRRGVDYMAVRSDTGAMLEGFRNSMRAFREA